MPLTYAQIRKQNKRKQQETKEAERALRSVASMEEVKKDRRKHGDTRLQNKKRVSAKRVIAPSKGAVQAKVRQCNQTNILLRQAASERSRIRPIPRAKKEKLKELLHLLFRLPRLAAWPNFLA